MTDLLNEGRVSGPTANEDALADLEKSFAFSPPPFRAPQRLFNQDTPLGDVFDALEREMNECLVQINNIRLISNNLTGGSDAQKVAA